MELGEVNVRRMKLEELCVAPYNPRVITERAFSGLSHSIDKFGLMGLIIWNERSGHVVGGHQRLKVLKEAGDTETDVVVVDLSDEDEVMLNIALNNPKSKADFTKDVVNLLAKSEVQLGSEFNRLGLNDLSKMVSKINFEFDEGKPKEKKPKKEREPKKKNETFLNEEVNQTDEPEAVIKCPDCNALWRMKDNKVIYKGDKSANQMEN